MTEIPSPLQLTHASTIYRAGGPKAVAKGLAAAGREVSENAVSAWVSRNVIPASYWHFFEKAGFATIEALDHASRQHREARQETRQGFRVPKGDSSLHTPDLPLLTDDLVTSNTSHCAGESDP
ncbi:MAG: hypothetical protein ACYDD1_00270 [Caulobacteraceae bacterium]